MALGLAELAASWPVAASLAAALTARGLTTGRKRMALNEAMHELRRPLHALALSLNGGGARPGGSAESALGMAVAALERLDREINGGTPGTRPVAVAMRGLLEGAAERWGPRAEAAGGSLALRWEAGGVRVRGKREELERALENLLANAIEHGGRRVSITAGCEGGLLRVAVCDRGGGGKRGARAEGALRRLASRLSGRRRRGHGLRLVRRIAAAHGGEFDLRVGTGETVASLVLPVEETRG